MADPADSFFFEQTDQVISIEHDECNRAIQRAFGVDFDPDNPSHVEEIRRRISNAPQTDSRAVDSARPANGLLLML